MVLRTKFRGQFEFVRRICNVTTMFQTAGFGFGMRKPRFTVCNNDVGLSTFNDEKLTDLQKEFKKSSSGINRVLKDVIITIPFSVKFSVMMMDINTTITNFILTVKKKWLRLVKNAYIWAESKMRIISVSTRVNVDFRYSDTAFGIYGTRNIGLINGIQCKSQSTNTHTIINTLWRGD